MEAKEKKEPVDKILSVDGDPKGSRVATTVFTNKATGKKRPISRIISINDELFKEAIV